ncbi:3-demethylubiquinone-9 3-methyltransferase, putative [Plasmodium malariae]|uniref:3-demethylubiquinone-9 3-methyltransferase, putative n=1 Tax=Plasmodium malariae TaxID=5858 RepID=A0A1C3KAG3_PLAMA|nr:3-demethylubiquinone-9 3-methyltransferase, putative [Plasmodium malariae]
MNNLPTKFKSKVIRKFAEVYKKFYSDKTFDEKEKVFFNNLENEWWKEKISGNGKFCDILDKIIGKNMYSLHDYNKQRFNFIFKNYEFIFFETLKKEKRNGKFKINILDVGCGGGILCEYMKNNIFYFLIKNDLISLKSEKNNAEPGNIEINIDGIDVSDKLIEVARKRQKKSEKVTDVHDYYNSSKAVIKEYFKGDRKNGTLQDNRITDDTKGRKKNCNVTVNLNYINCDIADLANSRQIEKKNCDIIISSEVIEHVPNDKKANFVKYISHLCNPMALVIFTTINKNILSYLYAILLAEYISGIIRRGTHDYDKFIGTNELNSICGLYNLKNLTTEYVMYLPIIRNYCTTQKLKLLYLSSFVYKNGAKKRSSSYVGY